MRNSTKQWVSRHPYTVTSLIFLVVVILGWQIWGWGELRLGFMLLLYFIVTLGVRLDEISRSIGGHASNPHTRTGDPDTVIDHLKEIEELLRRIDSKLPPPEQSDE